MDGARRVEQDDNEDTGRKIEVDDKCDVTMSVHDVSVIVNIKTLKRRLIEHKFNIGWVVGVVKIVERKKSVVGQFPESSIGEKRIVGLKN